MRETLNDNPIAQVALVGLLVVAAAFMFIHQSGGGEEESEPVATEATVSVSGTGQTATASGATPGEAVEGAVEGALEAAPQASPSTIGTIPAPPLPTAVRAAYRRGNTVALLFVHNGGIDDSQVKRAAGVLEGSPDVALFVVSSRDIARYAAATVGLEVNRVPALVVMKPKRLTHGSPEATVDYGYQTAEGIRQAVKDAAYEGRELAYHP
jgi:hypothetical protein